MIEHLDRKASGWLIVSVENPFAAVDYAKCEDSAQERGWEAGWPSSLRRWLTAPVRGGVGLNPASVNLSMEAETSVSGRHVSHNKHSPAIVC